MPPSWGTSCFRSIARIWRERYTEVKQSRLTQACTEAAERAHAFGTRGKIDVTHLVDRVDAWAEATVYTEYAAIDDGAEGEVVEHVAAVTPYVDGSVLAQTLVVEPIHLCDLSALVVAPDQRDAVWVPHLVCQQQQERLHAVVPAVDKVA